MARMDAWSGPAPKRKVSKLTPHHLRLPLVEKIMECKDYDKLLVLCMDALDANSIEENVLHHFRGNLKQLQAFIVGFLVRGWGSEMLNKGTYTKVIEDQFVDKPTGSRLERLKSRRK